MGTVRVNDHDVPIADGERLNAIQAAQRAGIEIPHYCWHPELTVVASCRMCLVEVGETKPTGVVMQPKLVPGCQTPVKDGMVVVSNSDKVRAAQQATLEYLLLNHPLDCPVCDQAGECFLQDYSYRYGRSHSRLQEPKLKKPDKDYIGDEITLFTDRCVMCTRCVRFTREYSGTAELQVISRGSHEEIDIFPGEPCNNKLAGNVVDLCPVGALCSKDFLYQQRVWWLKGANSVCPNCSTGCSIRVDQNEDVVYRLKPRFNPQAQGHFMCDEGRFGWKYIQSENRLVQPEMRQGGAVTSSTWENILPAVRAALEGFATSRPTGVAAVLSPWMTVEEAFMLAKYLKTLSPSITLAIGPVNTVGEDDNYPKDVHGNPTEPVRFTIRAEKCPNRRGVEGVLRYCQGDIIPFDKVVSQIASGAIESVYFAGGDPFLTLSDAQIRALQSLKLLIVQDILASPASAAAHYVLPGAAFAEKDGTFVNHSGLAQAIHRAVRAPGMARPDGRILWELAGRRGLYQPPLIRGEIARSISALRFSAVDLGEQGLVLTDDGTVAPPEDPTVGNKKVRWGGIPEREPKSGVEKAQ